MLKNFSLEALKMLEHKHSRKMAPIYYRIQILNKQKEPEDSKSTTRSITSKEESLKDKDLNRSMMLMLIPQRMAKSKSCWEMMVINMENIMEIGSIRRH